MRITKISLWHVPLTSKETYYMAENKTCDRLESVVIRVDTDANISGWGEVCPIPHYLPAYARGVLPAITEMAPLIIGSNPLGAQTLSEQLDRWLIGHEYAKSALDIAFWDITAKAAGLPLYQLLGGQHTQMLSLYHSITCIAPDDMAKIAHDAKKEGIKQFQVKLGTDRCNEMDIERLIKVRETVGPGYLVYGDWNAGSTQLDAIRVANATKPYDIMLEQPCETLEQCAHVKNATGLPMKIDENAYNITSLLKAYQVGTMDAVAIKTSKFGGLSKARQARDLCIQLGVKMCIEDTWGSDIVTTAALHLAASTDPKFIMNVCDLSYYVTPHLDKNAPRRERGYISPPQSIGLGIEPLLDHPDNIIE